MRASQASGRAAQKKLARLTGKPLAVRGKI
jgi:hypothetical protein